MLVKQVFIETGRSRFADEARAFVAGLMDQQQPGVMAALMNYIPGTNTPNGKFPVVQFTGGKNGFGLTGFGPAGAMILQDALPLIQAALAKELPGQIIKVDCKDLTLSVESRPYPLSYTIPRMVVQKKKGQMRRLQSQEEGAPYLEELFLNSLKRQAEAVGLILPGNLKVKFLGAEGDFAAKHKPSAKVAHLGLRNAVFELNARLGGIWTAGFMLSKGYGSFNATAQLGNGGGDALSK